MNVETDTDTTSAPTRAEDLSPRGHTLHTTLELPLPVEAVFPFFAAAGNLERITPPELRFRILSPLPLQMRQGTLPPWPLGEVALPLVRRQLERIFAHRRIAVREALLDNGPAYEGR